MKKMNTRGKGFTLVEILAVVFIIAVLLGVTVITFSRSQPSVRVKRDAVSMVSFLRNMWDHSRATGSPLILLPNYEDGTFSYVDPRTNKQEFAEFTSGARVIGILLNDRYYSETAYQPEDMDLGLGNEPLYLSEGRGLVQLAIVFALVEENRYEHITRSSLNLVTGKGKVEKLTRRELDEMSYALEEVSP
jgi:prepilin-type N-terminal cleavage/methylation domain-containing protein